jgi:hypothetical protein
MRDIADQIKDEDFDKGVIDAADVIAVEVEKVAKTQQPTYIIKKLCDDPALYDPFPKVAPIVNPIKVVERKILEEAAKTGSTKQYTTAKGKKKLRKMAESFWMSQIRNDPEIMGSANGLIAYAINPGMTGWGWNKDFTPADFASPSNPSRTDQMLCWASNQDWWNDERILVNGGTLVKTLQGTIDAFQRGQFTRDQFQTAIRDIVAFGVKGSIKLKWQEEYRDGLGLSAGREETARI